jgi:hypothetical protein
MMLKGNLPMTFDIHQQIFDEDGQPLEQEAQDYQDQLVELFDQSPEGEAISNEGIERGWARLMMILGTNNLGVTPPQISAHDMHEILFDLIPRKISVPANEAPDIIREFQAFWRFMQREFHLENATACLNVLNEKAAQELEERMSNPANFGMTKSFIMMGMQRGFDMQSQESIDEWTRTYNAELAAGTGTPIPFPGEQSMSPQYLASHIHILGAPTKPSRQSDDKQESRIAEKAPPTTRTHSYTPPLDKLISYTNIKGDDPLPEISYVETFCIGKDDIPELIRMATDEYLNGDDSNEFEFAAPLHAVRALAELHAEDAIEPLLTLYDKASQNDNEWMLETLVDVFTTIGPATLPSLEQFLADPLHDDSAKNYVTEILEQIADKYPETRTECIAIATRRLADFEVNDPGLNAFLIADLTHMKAVEAAPLIQEAFANDCVEEFWCGDWDEVQYDLGMKERPPRNERRSIFPTLSTSTPTLSTPTPARSTPTPTPSKPSIPHTPVPKSTKKSPPSKKAKAKVKMTKASKRANRKRN